MSTSSATIATDRVDFIGSPSASVPVHVTQTGKTTGVKSSTISPLVRKPTTQRGQPSTDFPIRDEHAHEGGRGGVIWSGWNSRSDDVRNKSRGERSTDICDGSQLIMYSKEGWSGILQKQEFGPGTSSGAHFRLMLSDDHYDLILKEKQGMKCIEVAMKLLALQVPSEHFQNGAPGREAWKAVTEEAMRYNIELRLSYNGEVRAHSVLPQQERRKCAQDKKYYTLAETIEFVYEKGGSLQFATNMWRDMSA